MLNRCFLLLSSDGGSFEWHKHCYVGLFWSPVSIVQDNLPGTQDSWVEKLETSHGNIYQNGVLESKGEKGIFPHISREQKANRRPGSVKRQLWTQGTSGCLASTLLKRSCLKQGSPTMSLLKDQEHNVGADGPPGGNSTSQPCFCWWLQYELVQKIKHRYQAPASQGNKMNLSRDCGRYVVSTTHLWLSVKAHRQPVRLKEQGCLPFDFCELLFVIRVFSEGLIHEALAMAHNVLLWQAGWCAPARRLAQSRQGPFVSEPQVLGRAVWAWGAPVPGARQQPGAFSPSLFSFGHFHERNSGNLSF